MKTHIAIIPELLQKIRDIQISINWMKSQIQQMRAPINVVPQIRRITDVVEDYCNLPRGSTYKQSRKRKIVEARQISMMIAHFITGLSTTIVACPFNMNHASVSNAKKAMRNLFETDVAVCDKFIRICNELKITDEIINQMINNT